MVALDGLNEDIIMVLASFLENRELLCLALSFSAAFKASDYRVYWKDTVDSFNLERLTSWQNYTGEELRRASLRAYRCWLNWTSDRPEPKRHIRWRTSSATWILGHTRWMARRVPEARDKAVFLDMLTGQETEPIEVLDHGTRYGSIQVTSLAPNEFILGYHSSDQYGLVNVKIEQQGGGTLRASATKIGSVPLYRGPAVPWCHDARFVLQASTTTTTESSSWSHDIRLFDLQKRHEHVWQAPSSNIMTCRLFPGWAIVVVRTDAIRLVALDLERIYRSSKTPKIKTLPTGQFLTEVQLYHSERIYLWGNDNRFTIQITKLTQTSVQPLAFSFVCSRSNDEFGSIRTYPWNQTPWKRAEIDGALSSLDLRDDGDFVQTTHVQGELWPNPQASHIDDTVVTFRKMDRNGLRSTHRLKLKEEDNARRGSDSLYGRVDVLPSWAVISGVYSISESHEDVDASYHMYRF